MPGAEMGSERRFSESDLVAVFQAPIDPDRIVDDAAALRIAPIDIATGFQHGGVAFIHHHLRAADAFEFGKVADVIPVTVGGGDDFDVGQLESERLDIGFDQRE